MSFCSWHKHHIHAQQRILSNQDWQKKLKSAIEKSWSLEVGRLWTLLLWQIEFLPFKIKIWCVWCFLWRRGILAFPDHTLVRCTTIRAEPMRTLTGIMLLCYLARHETVTVPLSPEGKNGWQQSCCWGNLTECWGVPCDGLVSHLGAIATLLAASSYKNRSLKPIAGCRDLKGSTTIIFNLTVKKKLYANSVGFKANCLVRGF